MGFGTDSQNVTLIEDNEDSCIQSGVPRGLINLLNDNADEVVLHRSA